MSRATLALQRTLESAGGLLPASSRFRFERRVRGYFEYRRLRRCDCAVVSFGKSGRTWLRVLISRLCERTYDLQGELLEFDNLHKQDPAVPRVLFTHDNYLRDFTGDGTDKRAYADKQTILLVRHPADVAVSQFFQWQHRMRPHKIALNGYPAPNSSMTPYDFLTGASGIGRVIAFMNEWAAFAANNDRLLVVRYEDLRSDTQATLARVARALQLSGYESWLADAVAYASFENMRAREHSDTGESDRLKAGDKDNPDSFKTRRAKVGGFADYLSPGEVEQVLGQIDVQLDPMFGYTRSAGTAANPSYP